MQLFIILAIAIVTSVANLFGDASMLSYFLALVSGGLLVASMIGLGFITWGFGGHFSKKDLVPMLIISAIGIASIVIAIQHQPFASVTVTIQ